MLTVINLSVLSLAFIYLRYTAFDEFFTENTYEFLQTIIKQLNIARTDIYLAEYSRVKRKQDNQYLNTAVGSLIDVCLIFSCTV